jgi:UDP-N-acetyl-D-glucosamine/UDP-N-acetyl-D-galactosamine dehydrogenase
MLNSQELRIAVIGLGYVGLPLAVEFGKRRRVVGFDKDARRIAQLTDGFDATLEVSADDIRQAEHLSFAATAEAIRDCNVYIVAIPTPIDKYKQPDLSLLLDASEVVGAVLKQGDIVIYESTVYPGATEEECAPTLERVSGLVLNRDFYIGYSPERVNPGDKTHRLASIVKITSGSTAEVAEAVDRLYREIVAAGTYRAPSIKVAEAAKVVENVQRDINIALMNELAIIFEKLNVDTEAVLRAAGSKWNFAPFRPGLVGGHCIGVDPYYLTHKALALGYSPEVILAGRRLNDGMGAYVASRLVKTMSRHGIPAQGARVLVMGLTFKENCPDLRNTRVIDVVRELEDYGARVDISDPLASKKEVLSAFGLALVDDLRPGAYEAIVVAVAHDAFRQAGVEKIRALGKPGHIMFDVKSMFALEQSDIRL